MPRLGYRISQIMISDAQVHETIQSTLERNKGGLAGDAVESVRHYMADDEFEMAFEGLFMEVPSLEDPVLTHSRIHYLEVARQLNLEGAPNFKMGFFEDFMKFLDRFP